MGFWSRSSGQQSSASTGATSAVSAGTAAAPGASNSVKADVAGAPSNDTHEPVEDDAQQQQQAQDAAAPRTTDASETSTASFAEGPQANAPTQARPHPTSYERLRVQVPGSQNIEQQQQQQQQHQQVQQQQQEKPKVSRAVSKSARSAAKTPGAAKKAATHVAAAATAAAAASASAGPPAITHEPALAKVDMAGAREALQQLNQQVQAQLGQQQALQQEQRELLMHDQQQQGWPQQQAPLRGSRGDSQAGLAPPERLQQQQQQQPGHLNPSLFTARWLPLPNGGAATAVPSAAAGGGAGLGLPAAAQQASGSQRGTGSHQAQLPDATWSAQQLLEECERRQQQLAIERRAREELEDMLLRLERHFKAETSVRENAEQKAAVAAAAEAEVKSALTAANRQREEEVIALQIEKETVAKERQALEEMRRQFDLEVNQARNEVAKAQEAVAGTEDRVRSTEAIERAKLEAEYETRLRALAAEAERRERELGHQMAVMQQEMLRWRQQAHLAAAAVLDAKNDLLERRRELGATNDRMDSLVEKLYAGRDHGIDLQGAIGAYYRIAAATAGPGAGALLPPLPALPGVEAAVVSVGDLKRVGGSGRLVPSLMRTGGGRGTAGQIVGQTGGLTNVARQQQQRVEAGAGASLAMSGRLPSLPAPLSPGAGGAVRGGGYGGYGGYTGPLPSSVAGKLQPGAAGGAAQRQQQQHHQSNKSKQDPGSYAKLHATAAGPQTDHLRGQPSSNGIGAGGGGGAAYSHVPSRVFASAAAYSATAGAEAKKRVEQRAKAAGKAPDRFADAARTASMIGAMASRWH